MHQAAEAAMDRPPNNRGEAGTQKTCAYCRQPGHDVSSCTYMVDAAAAARQRSQAAEEVLKKDTLSGVRNRKPDDFINPSMKRTRKSTAQSAAAVASGDASASGDRASFAEPMDGVADDVQANAAAGRGREGLRGQGGRGGRARGKGRGGRAAQGGGRGGRGGPDGGDVGQAPAAEAAAAAAANVTSTETEHQTVSISKQHGPLTFRILCLNSSAYALVHAHDFRPARCPPRTGREHLDPGRLHAGAEHDDADTAPPPQPGDPTLLHQEEDPKPKRTAASLAIGGCSKEKLSKSAHDFMEVVGEYVRVCGDGSCWLYSVLGAFGVVEHIGVQAG
eukprot:2969885-Pleurochrysis_carterae.AAC.2